MPPCIDAHHTDGVDSSSQPLAPRSRPGALGLRIGLLPPGRTDSLTDVPGVGVGHATVWRDEPDPPNGRGTARTGVTAIVPFEPESLFRARVPAGAAVLNGAGEAIGITSIDEWGVLETPIFLTSSMAIGRVYDAAVALLVDGIPEAGLDDALMPVVAECDDGRLNGSRVVQVDVNDVREALARAAVRDPLRAPGRDRPPAASGAVGAGTGMVAFELKGGIGQASRLVRPSDRRHAEAPSSPADAPSQADVASNHADAPSGAPVAGATTARQAAPGSGATYTLGALVLANFGRLERLTVDGVRVGEALRAAGWPAAGTTAGARGSGDMARGPTDTVPTFAEGGPRERGSCVVVLATDAPLLPHQLPAARSSSRARPGSHGLDRRPRLGGDLPRLLDGAPDPTTCGVSAARGPLRQRRTPRPVLRRRRRGDRGRRPGRAVQRRHDGREGRNGGARVAGRDDPRSARGGRPAAPSRGGGTSRRHQG